MDRKSKIRRVTTTFNDRIPAPVDRLSSLTDDILVDILNFLPNKTSVSTSVLSTRCRFLWTLINHINLDCRDFSRQTNEFYPVVYRLLFKISPPSLRSFALHVPYDGQPCLEHWLDYLCSQHNVEDVKISVEARDIPFDDTNFSSFTLPRCVFETESLVCLNLRCSSLNYELPSCDDDSVVVRLPNLRKMELSISASQCGFFAKLVRSCPLLEDLSLSTAIGWSREQRFQGAGYNGGFIYISCANLKRLYLDLFFGEAKDKVVIDAPKLVWLSLFGSELACSFVKKPISLLEARVGTHDQAIMSSILPAIMNVSVLHLYGSTFDKLEGYNSLIFRNLMELTLDVKRMKILAGWNVLESESTSSSLLRHVKKINVVVRSVENVEELEKLTMYLLSNARALERLAFVIGPRAYPSYDEEDWLNNKIDEMVFCTRVYSWSRNASKCLIEFHGRYAKLPVNIAEVQEMENQVRVLRDMSAALINNV